MSPQDPSGDPPPNTGGSGGGSSVVEPQPPIDGATDPVPVDPPSVA